MDISVPNQDITQATRQASPLISLPRELRDIILLYTILNDLQTFSLTTQRPPCLFVSHQLQSEYSSVLFSNNALLKLDTYKGSNNSWHEVADLQAKRDIFYHCKFAFPMVAGSNTPLGLLEFMGSARRACEELYYEKGESVRMGILTICSRGTGVRRWQWSMSSSEGEM